MLSLTRSPTFRWRSWPCARLRGRAACTFTAQRKSDGGTALQKLSPTPNKHSQEILRSSILRQFLSSCSHFLGGAPLTIISELSLFPRKHQHESHPYEYPSLSSPSIDFLKEGSSHGESWHASLTKIMICHNQTSSLSVNRVPSIPTGLASSMPSQNASFGMSNLVSHRHLTSNLSGSAVGQRVTYQCHLQAQADWDNEVLIQSQTRIVSHGQLQFIHTYSSYSPYAGSQGLAGHGLWLLLKNTFVSLHWKGLHLRICRSVACVFLCCSVMRIFRCTTDACLLVGGPIDVDLFCVCVSHLHSISKSSPFAVGQTATYQFHLPAQRRGLAG